MSETIFKRMGSVIATKLDTFKTDLETQIELSKYTLPAATDTTLGGVKINNVTHTINAGVLTLTASGASAGTYGSATNIPVLSVDTHGRVTGISTVAVSIPSGSISVTGGDLTMSGTTGVAITNATLNNSGVTAGTYGSSTQVPVLSIDSKGRVTSVSTQTAATATAYDVLIFVPETMLDGEVVHSFLVPRQFTLSTTGHIAKATAASLVNCTFNIKKDNTTIGTIYFASGSVTGTVTINAAPANTFAVGTKFQIVAPTPADVSLADVYISLLGTLG